MTHVSSSSIQESMRRLQTIPDKDEWKTTTSRVFKLNVAQYLSNKPKKKFIEFGGAQGHTAFFISPMAESVLSVDYDVSNCKKIDDLRCSNVRSMCCDLYGEDFLTKVSNESFDIAVIDAVHCYDNVKIDIKNAKSFGIREYIFDDYGGFVEVKKAVDEFIEEMKSNGHKVCINFIGMPPGSHYPNTTFQTLSDWEGLIVAID